MRLKDISVKLPYKKKVKFEATGIIAMVTSLYLDCIKGFDSGTFNKIGVEIDDKIRDLVFERKLDVIIVKKEFDFDLFASVDLTTKKKMILDVIRTGLLDVAKIDNLDQNAIELAYSCCLERGIEYKYFWKDKFFKNSILNIFASIWCEWKVDKFEAQVVFFDNSKAELYREKLFECEYWNLEPIAKAEWILSSSQFIVFSKDGSNKWTATFEHYGNK